MSPQASTGFPACRTQGSLADIYLFCQQHNYIVRFALMENFVHFTAKHMSMEMQLVRALLCTGCEHSKVGRLVCYITDNFRTSALQNETLDWELVVEMTTPRFGMLTGARRRTGLR